MDPRPPPRAPGSAETGNAADGGPARRGRGAEPDSPGIERISPVGEPGHGDGGCKTGGDGDGGIGRIPTAAMASAPSCLSVGEPEHGAGGCMAKAGAEPEPPGIGRISTAAPSCLPVGEPGHGAGGCMAKAGAGGGGGGGDVAREEAAARGDIRAARSAWLRGFGRRARAVVRCVGGPRRPAAAPPASAKPRDRFERGRPPADAVLLPALGKAHLPRAACPEAADGGLAFSRGEPGRCRHEYLAGLLPPVGPLPRGAAERRCAAHGSAMQALWRQCCGGRRELCARRADVMLDALRGHASVAVLVGRALAVQGAAGLRDFCVVEEDSVRGLLCAEERRGRDCLRKTASVLSVRAASERLNAERNDRRRVLALCREAERALVDVAAVALHELQRIVCQRDECGARLRLESAQQAAAGHALSFEYQRLHVLFRQCVPGIRAISALEARERRSAVTVFSGGVDSASRTAAARLRGNVEESQRAAREVVEGDERDAVGRLRGAHGLLCAAFLEKSGAFDRVVEGSEAKESHAVLWEWHRSGVLRVSALLAAREESERAFVCTEDLARLSLDSDRSAAFGLLAFQAQESFERCIMFQQYRVSFSRLATITGFHDAMARLNQALVPLYRRWSYKCTPAFQSWAHRQRGAANERLIALRAERDFYIAQRDEYELMKYAATMFQRAFLSRYNV
ncbi:hypothetical protein DIPPA_07418 [Diplonema papillatum]|nr:hypothetical protein DIPPA_07418 [Diplonema papillatum]